MSWIKLVEKGLIAGCFIAFLVLGYLWVRPSSPAHPDFTSDMEIVDPERGQPLTPQAYDSIGGPLLNLKFFPPTIQIPDLRRHLTYHGKNGRPDLLPEELAFHLSLKGGEERKAVQPGQRLFLRYIREKGKARYVFGEEEEETGLWIEVAPVVGSDQDLLINVGMKDPSGEEVLEPAELKTFNLTAGPATSSKERWMLGNHRVDASLLARMRVRWYGQDRFLEWHGGDDFIHTVGRERLDFGDGTTSYPCYVGEGDVLIWKGNNWEEAELGPATQSYPLMQVKKISDRVMNLELWDIGGPTKTALTLVKSRDVPVNQGTLRQFRFVGAKTHSQAILEINHDRLLLQKYDWLVFDQGQWQKIETMEEIDDFVSRKQRGELFVYDGIARKDGRQVLTGHVFNSSRTDVTKLEFAMGGGVETAPDAEVPAALSVHQELQAQADEPPRSIIGKHRRNP